MAPTSKSSKASYKATTSNHHHSSHHTINEGLFLYSEQIKTMTPTLHEKEEVEQNASDEGGQAYSYSPPHEAVIEAITTLNPWVYTGHLVGIYNSFSLDLILKCY